MNILLGNEEIMEDRHEESASLATIYVITDRTQYCDLLPTEVAVRISDTASNVPALLLAVDRLLLSWRAASYLSTVPGVWAHSSSDAVNLELLRNPERILSFAELFVRVLCTKVPDITTDPSLRKKLLQLGVEATSNYSESLEHLLLENLYDKAWEEMLAMPAFHMYVWRSQSAAFVDFFAAYEAFLMSTARVRDPSCTMNVSNRDCHKKLAELFGEPTSQRCWSGGRVATFREARNAIAHNSSYETAKLKAKNHSYKVVQELLSITIDDNKEIVKVLDSCVIELIKCFD